MGPAKLGYTFLSWRGFFSKDTRVSDEKAPPAIARSGFSSNL
jgi:hypothetical protein